MQAYDLKGEVIEKVVSDLESRLWQHEVDHLDGILFIDKMGTIAKLSSRSVLKEFEQISSAARRRAKSRPRPSWNAS